MTTIHAQECAAQIIEAEYRASVRIAEVEHEASIKSPNCEGKTPNRERRSLNPNTKRP